MDYEGLAIVFPQLAGIVIESVDGLASQLVITGRGRDAFGSCPSCGGATGRVHGRYTRTIKDAPAGGRGVTLKIEVVRLKCVTAPCQVRTFTLQIPGLTGLFSRYTPVLEGWLDRFGLALAGRAGSRLSGALAAGASRHTLLRRVRALPDPRIRPGLDRLGIDDFAIRRGRVYGTVMVDMRTHRPIDLIEGRTADVVAPWLGKYPRLAVICRDRAGGYAEAADLGAPQAAQVADKWHLWHNLGEAVEKDVARHRSGLCAAEPEATAAPAPPPRPEGVLAVRTRARYARIKALQAEGLGWKRIRAATNLAPGTVKRFMRAECVEELLATGPKPSKLDPYKPFLHEQWNAGNRNAGELHRQITARGFVGHRSLVVAYLGAYRAGPAPAAAVAPRPRQAAGWMMTLPAALSAEDRAALTQILERSPALAGLAGHVRAFAEMMVNRHGHLLDDWISAAENDELPALRSFARGLQADYDAVRNGLSSEFSSGAVEGNVTRIKALKRQMYGRAKFDLLRKRVLLSP